MLVYPRVNPQNLDHTTKLQEDLPLPLKLQAPLTRIEALEAKPGKRTYTT